MILVYRAKASIVALFLLSPKSFESTNILIDESYSSYYKLMLSIKAVTLIIFILLAFFSYWCHILITLFLLIK